jgi:hypothetical protein
VRASLDAWALARAGRRRALAASRTRVRWVDGVVGRPPGLGSTVAPARRQPTWSPRRGRGPGCGTAPSVHPRGAMRVERERVGAGGPAARACSFSAAMARARVRAEAEAAAVAPGRASARELDPALRRQSIARSPGACRPPGDREAGEAGEAASALTGGAAACDARRDGAVAPRPPIASAAALERLVVDLASRGGYPSITLTFGSDGPLVRLTARAGGLEIALELPRSPRVNSMAELFALAAAVRARGVARATGRSRSPAAPRPPAHALTAARGSYRTAPRSGGGGTVAKW